MVKDLEQLYKELAAQASKDGYYLIPKTFYEKMFNALDEHKVEVKRVRDINEKLRGTIRELKEKLKNGSN